MARSYLPHPNILEIEASVKALLAAKNHPILGQLQWDTPDFARASCPHVSNPNNLNVSYKVYTDGIPHVFFECHSCQIKFSESLKNKNKTNLSEKELQNYQKISEKRKRDKQEKIAINHKKAAENARKILVESRPCTHHDYLSLKNVKSYGLRVCARGELLIPRYNSKLKVVNFQRIFWDKDTSRFEKRPLKGAQCTETFYLIGAVTDSQKIIYLAEGYSTAATVYEATGVPTVISFGCNNLSSVAKIIRKLYPKVQIVIAADVDENSAGENAAKKACSQVVNCTYILPDFSQIHSENTGEKNALTDFNDLYCELLKGFNRIAALDKVQLNLLNVNKDLDMLSQIPPKTNEKYANDGINNDGKILYRSFSEIKSKPIGWIWPDKIPKGKISIIAGDPGVGKSQLTINLAATESSGRPWLDGTLSTHGSVIFLSAEDSPEDTIRPRLEAARADLNNVYCIDAVKTLKNKNSKKRYFNLGDDLENLSLIIDEINKNNFPHPVSLIIIDPISAYLGKIDSNNNSAVRSLLMPVGDFAEKNNVGVIGISHFSKNEKNSAQSRVMGSLAFIAAARVGYAVIKDKDSPNESERLFLPLKNNLANDKGGHSFTVESCTVNGIETSKIQWTNKVVTQTAEELMSIHHGGGRALAEAEDFLVDLLGSGDVLQIDVFEKAKEAGISDATLRRAKYKLKVNSYREKIKNGRWFWNLPKEENSDDVDDESLFI